VDAAPGRIRPRIYREVVGVDGSQDHRADAVPRADSQERAVSRGEGREVLFLAQLPPPLHGQSAMAKAVRDVMADHEGCRITQMWGGGADGNGDIGRRSLRKYLGFGLLL